MTREEIIRRAQKLSAFTEENATPQEVANAAAALKKLMEKHQLSMMDIASGLTNEDVGFESIDGGSTRKTWQLCLVCAIAKGLDCQVVTHYDGQWRGRRWKQTGIVYKVYGVESDLVFARYLYDVLSVKFYTQGTEYCRGLGYSGAMLISARATFVMGAARAVKERLIEQRGTAEENSLTNALVVCKGNSIDAYIRKNVGKTFKDPVRHGTLRADDAAEAGYWAGKSAPLNRGLEKSNEGVLLLEAAQ
ncbi:MAG: hypothetical protein AMXMBFR84_37470 [Candidatus Hydrogenedentota bacterium]